MKETSFHLASTSGRKDVISILLNSGANINAGDKVISDIRTLVSSLFLFRMETRHFIKLF
jgi:ankyrin repeat protein